MILVKQYRNLPAAHRQHRHIGHCRLIHGHNWGVDLAFVSEIGGVFKPDRCGFVLDVGEMGWAKAWLEQLFDHTLLLSEDDPELPRLKRQMKGLAAIVVVPDCSMEGLARYIFESLSRRLKLLLPRDVKKRGLRLLFVRVHEDEKNSVTYQPRLRRRRL